MKKLILLFLSSFCTIASAQQEWINCTSGHFVRDILYHNDIIYTASTGGLVKSDLSDGTTAFFNRGNSPIPSNDVHSLAMDTNGRLWLSTDKGTAVFDGNDWDLFYEKSGRLHLDDENNMIIAEKDSLHWWNGQSFESIALPFSHFFEVADMEVDFSNGDIWLSYWTYGVYAVYRFNNSVFTLFDNQNSVLPFESPALNPLLLDTQNRLWAGNTYGLFRFENGTWASVQDLIPGFPEGEVSALEIDSDGSIWAAVTHDWIDPQGQLVKIISDDEIASHPLPNTFGDYRKVEALEIIDAASTGILVGSRNFGLWKYDFSQWSKIGTDQSAARSNSIRQIFVDGTSVFLRSGRYLPDGKYILSSILAEDWFFFDEDDLPFSSHETYSPVFVTKGPGGYLWVHSGDALYTYKDQQWTEETLPDITDNVDENNSYIHFEPNGNRWLLDKWQSYIFYESDQGWQVYEHPEHGAVSGIYQAFFNHPSTGDFWLASANGISRFDGEEWQIIKPEDLGLGSNYINSMVVDDNGTVWASTYQAILKIENNVPELFIQDIPQLPGNQFRSLALDEADRLWVGLHGAMAMYENGSWTVFDNANSGIPNGTIAEMQFDDWGNLWIGSQQGGLAVYNPSGLPGYLTDGFHANTMDSLVAEPEIRFNIFPNPVSRTKNLKVQLPSGFNISNKASFEIFNSLGQTVVKGPIDSYWTVIPVHAVEAAGTYFLQIKNDSESLIGKIIIY